jgi:hypothetical protein
MKHLGKSCKKCQVIITVDNQTSGNNGVICKPCYNAKARKYFQKYKEKHRALMYEWRARNKEKVKEMHVDYCTRKHGGVKQMLKTYFDKNKEQVTDTYCKFVIISHSPLQAADITPELIHLKRQSIILHRKIELQCQNQKHQTSMMSV